MDTVRDRDYVECLPHTTKEELRYKEAVQDHQSRLTEEWAHYARGSGRREAAEEEHHTKWFTETWTDFEERKRSQAQILDLHKKVADKANTQAIEKRSANQKKSQAVVDKLMALETILKSKKMQSRHYLFTNFEELQQFNFLHERMTVEGEETLLREKLLALELESTFIIALFSQLSYEIYYKHEEERLKLEEEERRGEEMRKQQQVEEEARLKREHEREMLEIEKQRREQAELEKRLERKRRDDERRAKARAEREQRKVE